MSGAYFNQETRLRRFWHRLAARVLRTDDVFSLFELWPSALFYTPLVVQWAWLACRHRSLTLPTLANPGMQCGGLVGESKSEILAQMGREGRNWVAPYTCFAVGIASGGKSTHVTQAMAALETAGIGFPFVAKPDIGCRGAGVRIIRTTEDLSRYLATFPRGARVIFQTLIDTRHEAGIFYVREPGREKGRIVSVTLKLFPEVVGDGTSTLEQLIMADPRARRISDVYLKRHAKHRNRVLAPGEVFRLVFTGNHCRGAVFQDGRAHITPEMEARFEAIARGMPEFHFGRFDVRYDSLDDLKAGRNFKLIEVNGAGSEATHIWDRHTTLGEAYRFLFYQQRILFEIGAHNRARGYSTVTALRVIQLALKQFWLGRSYCESS